MKQGEGVSADSRTRSLSQSSVSSEESERNMPGESVEEISALSAEQEQQDFMSSEAQRASCDGTLEKQIASRRSIVMQQSRRAEAMAALEGRHHSLSPG